jgi:hypothetical protein
LGPLGTAAANWPIVPAPGDYDDGAFGGIMIVRGTEVLGENLPLCPPQTPHALPRRERGPQRWETRD